MININSWVSKIMSAMLSVLLLFMGTTADNYDYSECLGNENYVGLKTVYEAYFDIGTSVGSWMVKHEDYYPVLLKNYSSLTGENAFKLEYIHPSEDVWSFKAADMIADFAREHDLKLRGHVLVSSGKGNWMLYDDDGNFVDKEVFYQRQYDYFKTMMERYGDIIHTWDVVNEPFNYEVGSAFKDTEIFRLCGEKYIIRSFEMAHEIDPDATLVLNETRIVKNNTKMNNLLEYVEKYVEAGVPIDAVGLQSHYDTLSITETASRLDKLINKIADLGLDVQITEMDMTFYSTDYVSYDEMPEWVQTLQIKKYQEIFEVLRKNADKISSVTFWGMNDSVSFYTADSIERPNWPLIFDENNQPKQAFYAICDF